LCGIALPTGLMVPDGGPACADIRWYCKDAKSCTERWTSRPPAPAPKAAIPAATSAGAGESASHARESTSEARPSTSEELPAEQVGGTPEKA
jgi:hypothetical protein